MVSWLSEFTGITDAVAGYQYRTSVREIIGEAGAAWGRRWKQWAHLFFHMWLILILQAIKDLSCKWLTLIHFAWLTGHPAMVSMRQAISFFQYAFSDYVATENTSNLPRLQQVCSLLGQSWSDVVQIWQTSPNSTSLQYGNVTAIDPIKRYTWYTGAITSIITVCVLHITSWPIAGIDANIPRCTKFNPTTGCSSCLINSFPVSARVILTR